MNRDTNTKGEKNLEPSEVNWSKRKEQAAEHPTTGAPKKGSLLKVLADEALSKGRPVLVIPLDAAEGEADATAGMPAGEEDEPPHDLRLPNNTTVIFSGNEGFPATAGMSRIRHVQGDPDEDVARRASSPNAADRAAGTRIVDPPVAVLRWNPLSGEPSEGESEKPGQPERAQGGHH